MRHSMLLEKMINGLLGLVFIAAFAVAGCSSAPPIQRDSNDQSNNLVGSRSLVGVDCPVR